MRQTKNKNMNLPEYADVIDIEKLNENFETIDEHFTDPKAHIELFLALDKKMSDRDGDGRDDPHDYDGRRCIYTACFF